MININMIQYFCGKGSKDIAISKQKEGEMLFATDIETDNATKRFFNASYSQIKKMLKSDSHIYEHYGYKENQDVKFFVDIDYKIGEDYGIEYDSKTELLNEITDSVELILKKHNLYESGKIVLDASTDSKYSFHIIYENIIFTDIKNMNAFIVKYAEETENKYNKIFDSSVYANRCFRCINQTKKGKYNALKGDCKVLNSLICYVEKKENIQRKTFTNNKQEKHNVKHIKPSDCVQVAINKTVIQMTTAMISDIVRILDKKRSDNYSSWLAVMLSIKCENKNELFSVFDEFSSHSDSYNKQNNIQLWNNHTPTETKAKYTYNSLLYWAKIDNPEEYMKFCIRYNLFGMQEEQQNIQNKHTLEISQQYLLPDKKLSNDVVSKCINNFLANSQPSLMIESPYNTGKTTLLTQICTNYKRIAFLSYRITLTNNLYGTFKNLGFQMYSDNIDADRVICQIDSLHKISNMNFDLIIMDESESILNHYSSSSLKEPNYIFELMIAMCINAKKIVALDGDLGNRSMTFMNSFGESSLIKNVIQKDKRHFKFYKSQDDFDLVLENAVTRNKNICIVSMSEQLANLYYERLSQKYSTIKYTSKTDDKDKKLLADVKSIWGNHQVVIYSPCIESGVDYDIEHFDNIFVLLSGNSTSQRGLCQMMNRVRKITDSNICVYLNNIPTNETSIRRHYTFEEIQAFYKTLANEQIQFTMQNDKIMIDNGETFNLYDVIQMYNKQETLNKNSNCFLPLLIKALQKKGHTYEIIDGKKAKKQKTNNIVMQNVVDAETIDELTFDNLKIAQAKQELTENDKYAMTKYIYEKTFDTKFDDVEHLKQYYNRLNIIKNAKSLTDDSKITLNNSELKNKEKVSKILQVRKILNVLNIDGNKLLTDKISVQKIDLEENLETFENIMKENKILFGLAKTTEIKTTKKLLGTLNNILNNYGIEILTTKKNKRVDNKFISQYSYIVQYELEVLNTMKKHYNIIGVDDIDDIMGN